MSKPSSAANEPMSARVSSGIRNNYFRAGQLERVHHVIQDHIKVQNQHVTSNKFWENDYSGQQKSQPPGSSLS